MPDHLETARFEIVERFPDAESARVYLEQRRWGPRIVCPHCTGHDRITARKGKRLGYYRCRDCRREFTVRTATPLERSRLPLHKWIHAMHLIVTTAKLISSARLSRELGVTQKTAWWLLRRLRDACGGDIHQFAGTAAHRQPSSTVQPPCHGRSGKTKRPE